MKYSMKRHSYSKEGKDASQTIIGTELRENLTTCTRPVHCSHPPAPSQILLDDSEIGCEREWKVLFSLYSPSFSENLVFPTVGRRESDKVRNRLIAKEKERKKEKKEGEGERER